MSPKFANYVTSQKNKSIPVHLFIYQCIKSWSAGLHQILACLISNPKAFIVLFSDARASVKFSSLS